MHDPWDQAARFPKTRRGHRIEVSARSGTKVRRDTYQNSGIMVEYCLERRICPSVVGRPRIGNDNIQRTSRGVKRMQRPIDSPLLRRL